MRSPRRFLIKALLLLAITGSANLFAAEEFLPPTEFLRDDAGEEYNAQIWELKKHNKRTNIRVYLQKELNSRVKSFKVITETEANIPTIMAVLMDEKNHASWMEGVTRAKIVKLTDDAIWEHFVLDMPHPVQDRDFVVHIVFDKDPETGVVTLTGQSDPGFLDDEDGLLRMPYSLSWTLTPLEDGKTQIEFLGEGGLGGFVQPWAVNYLFDTFPYFTMKNMQGLFGEERYRNSKKYKEWGRKEASPEA